MNSPVSLLTFDGTISNRAADSTVPSAATPHEDVFLTCSVFDSTSYGSFGIPSVDNYVKWPGTLPLDHDPHRRNEESNTKSFAMIILHFISQRRNDYIIAVL